MTVWSNRLLNANKINCLRVDAFQDLHNLNLLSLYDNKLQTVAKGTFSALRAIQTMYVFTTFTKYNDDYFQCECERRLVSKSCIKLLCCVSERHLAQNPFICDCHLKWLADYLHTNPIETSGARCTSPRRLANKRIGQIKSKKFRCSGNFSLHEPFPLGPKAMATWELATAAAFSWLPSIVQSLFFPSVWGGGKWEKYRHNPNNITSKMNTKQWNGAWVPLSVYALTVQITGNAA